MRVIFGIFLRNKVVLVHDNCIDEFIILVSQKRREVIKQEETGKFILVSKSAG
jgi:hypothetical protein